MVTTMIEALLFKGGSPRKTIANIWNCFHLNSNNLYALGYPQKSGDNSLTLNFDKFTKTDINVKDVSLACGSTIKLDTLGNLYGSGDNSVGCLGIGNTTSQLGKWVSIAQASFDSKPVKLAGCGSTLSTLGVITTAGSLYMAGRNNSMGIGDSSENASTTWRKVRSNVKAFASNDSKFTIVAGTDGYAAVTGAGTSGTFGMYGNGRTSTFNASFEGTPTIGNTAAINFVDVEVVSGTTIGLTASGDLYISGMGWKLVNGSVTYTESQTDFIYTFVKIASGVVNYAFGGSGGGGAWKGVCLAWTDIAGNTYYIGTNVNGVAGTGATAAQVPFYSAPTRVGYLLVGKSTFSWAGVYNSTSYQYAFYDTINGIGFAGIMGGVAGTYTLSNTTGNLLMMPIT